MMADDADGAEDANCDCEGLWSIVIDWLWLIMTVIVIHWLLIVIVLVVVIVIVTLTE